MYGTKHFIIGALAIWSQSTGAMQALRQAQEKVARESQERAEFLKREKIPAEPVILKENEIALKTSDGAIVPMEIDVARLSGTIDDIYIGLGSEAGGAIPLKRVTKKQLQLISKDMSKILDVHRAYGEADYVKIRDISLETRRNRAEKAARALPIPEYSSQAFADAIDCFKAADFLQIPELKEIYGRAIAQMLISDGGLELLSRDASILNQIPVGGEPVIDQYISLLLDICEIGGIEFGPAIFSPDRSKVVTRSDEILPDGTHSKDKTVKIWNTNTCALEYTLAEQNIVDSVEFSPDGSKMMTCSDEILPNGRRSRDKTAKIWNTNTGALEHILQHDDVVNSASFSPDGSKVVTASNDWTAKIWNTNTGVLEHMLQHKNTVNSASFSPDRSKVVTISSDETAKIWNATTGVLEHTLQLNSMDVRGCFFSPGGSKVFTISDQGVDIWNAVTGALLWHTTGGEISPDEKRYAHCSGETLEIRNANTGIVEHILRHGNSVGSKLFPPSYVNSASFSPDGSKVVTASKDGTAKIWNTNTGALEHTLQHDNAVYSASFSPDGRKVVTFNNKTVKIWNADTGALEYTIVEYTSYSTIIVESVVHLWDRNRMMIQQRSENSGTIKIVQVVPLTLPGVVKLDAVLFTRLLFWAKKKGKKITDTTWAPRVKNAIEWHKMDAPEKKELQALINEVMPAKK